MATCKVVMFGVNPEPMTGGAVYHLRVLQRLRALGVDVRNVSLPPDIPRLPLPIRLLLANFTILREFPGLRVTPCILFEDCYSHARFFLTNWWAQRHGAKIVMLMQFNICQDHRLLRHPFWRRIDHLILRRFLQQGDVVLANSEQSARDVLSLGCSPDKVKVIYCGGDIQLDSQAAHRSYALDGAKFRLLFVGSVIERKGLRYLLQALAVLPDSSLELDVVGDTQDEPGYLAEMKTLIEDHGLTGQVTFHGHIADRERLRQLYRKADVFVLPSLYETFGIVLLEAMAFGLPIVTTTAGAIPELVKDGKNGLLVPPRDPVALAEALKRMAGSAELRRGLGQSGYEFVARRRNFYSWEAVGERVLRAIEPLLPAEGKR